MINKIFDNNSLDLFVESEEFTNLSLETGNFIESYVENLEVQDFSTRQIVEHMDALVALGSEDFSMDKINEFVMEMSETTTVVDGEIIITENLQAPTDGRMNFGNRTAVGYGTGLTGLGLGLATVGEQL